MKNIKPALCTCFEETPEDAKSEKKLAGYQFIKCHMIFKTQIENFKSKAQFVADGHTTEGITDTADYSNAVSRDSVQLHIIIETLHDLDFCAYNGFRKHLLEC